MSASNVVIILARCCRLRQLFGIRMAGQAAKQWEATWAFPIKERTAAREGYDKTRIEGSFSIPEGYPGCPYCQSRGFFKCGTCNQVGCWNQESRTVTCPWCDHGGELSGTIQSLEAGSDR